MAIGLWSPQATSQFHVTPLRPLLFLAIFWHTHGGRPRSNFTCASFASFSHTNAHALLWTSVFWYFILSRSRSFRSPTTKSKLGTSLFLFIGQECVPLNIYYLEGASADIDALSFRWNRPRRLRCELSSSRSKPQNRKTFCSLLDYSDVLFIQKFGVHEKAEHDTAFFFNAGPFAAHSFVRNLVAGLACERLNCDLYSVWFQRQEIEWNTRNDEYENPGFKIEDDWWFILVFVKIK